MLRPYVRVSDAGSPRSRNSFATGNPHLVLAAAPEVPQFAVDDALRICLVLPDGDRDRYERAAARWLGGFALEAGGVAIDELQLAADAVDALPHEPSEVMERVKPSASLAGSVGAFGASAYPVSSVAGKRRSARTLRDQNRPRRALRPSRSAERARTALGRAAVMPRSTEQSGYALWGKAVARPWARRRVL